MVLEARLGVAVRVRQRHPQLRPVQDRRVVRRAFLGVRDAAARGHQAELVRAHGLQAAETVAVQHLAVVQPADGLKTHVRMRRDLHARSVRDVVGAVVVDEAPGADHPAAQVRQQPPHLRAFAQGDDFAGQQLVYWARGHVLSSSADRGRGAHVEVAHAGHATPGIRGHTRDTVPYDHRRV
nr:hypothetical protein [Actinocrinis puniceicyclus]